MSFLTWIIIFFGAAFAFGLLLAICNTHLKKELTAKLMARYPDANIHADADGTYIVVDTVKRIVIVGQDRPTVKNGAVAVPFECVYVYAQIARVEINKDGDTLISTNRGSQAVGSALGAIAFGGVGAIIGGLSGSSTSRATVRRISLKLIVDDPKFPFHDITFFDTDGSTGVVMKDPIRGLPARQAMERIQEIHALVVGAIRSADTDNQKLQLTKNTANIDVVSQLKDLWKLHETGAITHAEFEKQKHGLLNS